jgi:hypothetical protein
MVPRRNSRRRLNFVHAEEVAPGIDDRDGIVVVTLKQGQQRFGRIFAVDDQRVAGHHVLESRGRTICTRHAWLPLGSGRQFAVETDTAN